MKPTDPLEGRVLASEKKGIDVGPDEGSNVGVSEGIIVGNRELGTQRTDPK